MNSKSRSALIGLIIFVLVATAWWVRSLNVATTSGVPASAVAAIDQAQPTSADMQDSATTTSIPSAATTAAAAARALVFGEHGPVTLADIPEGSFRRALLRLQGDSRAQALEQLGRLRVPVNNLASLRVDSTGRLFYFCAPPNEAQLASLARKHAATATAESPAVAQQAAVPVSSPPVRHSRPGASKVIYLDFNGHDVTGTHWNEGYGAPGDADYEPAVATFHAQAYDTDSNPATFSDAEQAAIVEIWARVAEDYAPFDVDVTTEQPASFTARTSRILVTKSKDANGVAMPSGSAGGVAYIDVFGYSNSAQYSPAFIYYESLSNDIDATADAAAHEMGHNLGLEHDGTATEEYYYGHSGGGVPSWGPLMGAAYNKELTQWSKGEYTGANNTQDDLAVIAAKLGYRPDDVQDSNNAASALTVAGNNLSASGLIGATGDADRFSFSGSGSVSFEVAGKPVSNSTAGTNLDVALELYDATGNLVASGNNPGTASASLSASLAGGTYYLRVRGTGAGTPAGTPPNGYSAYGSLGKYTLTGTVAAGAPPQISKDPASITVIAGQGAGLAVVTSGATGYRWQRQAVGTGAWTDLSDGAAYSGTTTSTLMIAATTLAMNGDMFRVRATNVAGTTVSGAATLSVIPPVPPRPALFSADAYLANNPDVAAVIGNPPDRAQKAWEHYWKYGVAEGRTDGDFNAQAYLKQYPNAGTTPHAAALYWYTTGRKNGDRIPKGFDVAGYLARNADIAALFSQDKYGAWLHYYNYGLYEGRSFDANFIPAEYLELNADLKGVFGSNLQAAVMHWFNYGHSIEDRMGRVPIGFNVDSYLSRYPDLAAVFGNIKSKAVRNVTVWNHYLAYGTLEGRSDGDFEAYNYLATNSDLAAIFGTDVQAAAVHWYFYGRREGRRIPGGFNAQNYRALYPDVVLVYGDDLYGSWIHYRDNGVFEGRVYDDLFRPDEYLALNPEVAAVIGTDRRDALLHWLFYGRFERRKARY